MVRVDWINEKLRYLAERNNVNQDVFVMEEMAELQKELTKHRRGYDNRDKIVDESCDVLITVFILFMIYNATDEEVKKNMEYKLNRLRDFIPE